MRVFICLFVVSIRFAPISAHADPKDIAELFPADSLTYVEVSQPGATAKALSEFLKGTAFARAHPGVDSLKEKPKPNESIDASNAGLLSACLSPKMLKEAARFKAIAGALTGFNKNGEPEFVVVVLTGESPLPGYLMRAYFSTQRQASNKTKFEGFELFQQHALHLDVGQLAELPGGADPAPRQARPVGPIYTSQSGIVIIASNRTLIESTIRRWNGKEKSESLAAKSQFKDLAEERKNPGLFLYADGKPLLEKFYAISQAAIGGEPYSLAVLRKVVPAAGIRTAVARLELGEQGVDLRCSLKLNGKEAGPLADFLVGQSIALPDLSSLTNDSPLSLSINLPTGERRLPRLLAVLDAFIKATGTLGPTASEIFQELDEKKSISIAAFGRINRITLTMPPISIWPKGVMPMPSLMVHCDSKEDVIGLEMALPAVLELLGGGKGECVTETIDGVKIRSLESKASPMGMPLHFGRKDKALAIGTDRKFLSVMLNADPTKSVTANAEIGAALKNVEKSSVVGVWNWADTQRQRTSEKKLGSEPRLKAYQSTIPIDVPSYDYPVRGGNPSLRFGEWLDQLGGLPPMVISLGREKDEIRLEIRQRDPRGLRAKAIGKWFDWYGQNSRDGGFNRGMSDGTNSALEIFEPPPLPPLAPQ